MSLHILIKSCRLGAPIISVDTIFVCFMIWSAKYAKDIQKTLSWNSNYFHLTWKWVAMP